jgi:peptide methionine sulfoxide reductase msrA/msrB
MRCLLAIVVLMMGSPPMPQSPPSYSKSGHDITPLSEAEVASLASKLNEEAFRITQRAGTEQPFCGTLLDNKKDGFYACVVCGLPLFSSKHKFTSGTGWPSFYTPYDPSHVSTQEDQSGGRTRTEVLCSRCNSHLGHVFPDGPQPTGDRHCLNSAALHFVEDGADIPEASKPVESETAYFAGGCFWGVEHWFQKGPGVIDAVSGYMQGTIENPTYKDVCSGRSGHAETVKVTFDPKVISFGDLLNAFFRMHDPTEVDRQGPDTGTQYRSGIWCADEAQLREARDLVAKLGKSAKYERPIATQVEEAGEFFPAEKEHQDFIANTGRACHVVNPWSETANK